MKNIKYSIVLILSLLIITGCNLFCGKTYTVSFMVDDEVYEVQTDVASNILVPTEEPTKDGYEFDDWYFDETYLSKFNTNELKSLKVTDVNVFARFLTLYNLSFETNGGEYIGSYLDAKIDTMPACTKSGFILYAWYFDAGFQNKAEFPLIITEDTTLYAKWAKNEITVNYFLDNETYETETISYGEAPSLPVPNNKMGHKFSGWKDASGVDFTFNGVLFDNIDLYATFDPKDYVIYYDYLLYEDHTN